MSNAEHLADALEAVEDIRADGQAAKLYVRNPAQTPAWGPDYNPDTGTDILILRLEQTQKYKDDQMSLDFMEKVMIARSPTNLSPSIGDDIEVDGRRSTILLLKPFAPAGELIFWEAEIGRG